MKFSARLNLMGPGLGLILLTAAPSFATLTPAVLNTGGNSTVTVTPTGITFTENDTALSSTEVGTGTTLSYSGGSLSVGQPINITGTDSSNLVTPGTLPATLSFPDEPGLSIVLDTFGPGSANTNCSGLSVGESCSPSTPSGTSPIILTATNSGTTAILPVAGYETDNGMNVGSVTGEFSANIAGESPAVLASSASFTTTYSGQLVVTPMSAVPEPRTVSMIALAGLLMGLVVAKRRKATAEV